MEKVGEPTVAIPGCPKRAYGICVPLTGPAYLPWMSWVPITWSPAAASRKSYSRRSCSMSEWCGQSCSEMIQIQGMAEMGGSLANRLPKVTAAAIGPRRLTRTESSTMRIIRDAGEVIDELGGNNRVSKLLALSDRSDGLASAT